MLTAASIGLAFYGLYSVVVGAHGLLAIAQLEWWANIWLIGSGLMLVMSSVFVRASTPGGLALANAGLLGLQSISLHNSNHLYGEVSFLPQVARAVLAVLLATLAYAGWDEDRTQIDRESTPRTD